MPRFSPQVSPLAKQLLAVPHCHPVHLEPSAEAAARRDAYMQPTISSRRRSSDLSDTSFASSWSSAGTTPQTTPLHSILGASNSGGASVIVSASSVAQLASRRGSSRSASLAGSPQDAPLISIVGPRDSFLLDQSSADPTSQSHVASVSWSMVSRLPCDVYARQTVPMFESFRRFKAEHAKGIVARCILRWVLQRRRRAAAGLEPSLRAYAVKSPWAACRIQRQWRRVRRTRTLLMAAMAEQCNRALSRKLHTARRLPGALLGGAVRRLLAARHSGEAEGAMTGWRWRYKLLTQAEEHAAVHETCAITAEFQDAAFWEAAAKAFLPCLEVHLC